MIISTFNELLSSLK